MSSVSSSIIILCLLSLESLLYHVVTLPSDDVVCPISHYLSVYSQNGPLLQRKQVLLENGGFDMAAVNSSYVSYSGIVVRRGKNGEIISAGKVKIGFLRTRPA